MKSTLIVSILILSIFLSGCIDNVKSEHNSINISNITPIPTPTHLPTFTPTVTTPPIPTPIPTPTSTKTSVLTYDYKKYTYEDEEGNIHQVEDYTSQGGARFDRIIIPVNTTDISEPIIFHNITINVKNYKDNIIIKRVLNKTDEEILKYITSITVFYSNIVECGEKETGLVIFVGCTEPSFNNNIFSSAKISVISDRNGIVQEGKKDVCSSLEFVLNHEIGHVKGFTISVEDRSESYANKYAEEHTPSWKNIYDC